jgi:hypothetical protein
MNWPLLVLAHAALMVLVVGVLAAVRLTLWWLAGRMERRS